MKKSKVANNSKRERKQVTLEPMIENEKKGAGSGCSR